ncbi:MAG: hypothetical protein H7X97_11970 [Opitutaceae bacterium]|nr:hypothetical protein [Verrucomicrobiales bacterium]
MNRRSFIAWLSLGLVGLSTLNSVAAAAGGNLISWSFIGTRRIVANTNAVTLGKIAALPESGPMLDRLAQKLAGSVASSAGLPAGATAKIQPLLVDLFQFPSAGSWQGASLATADVGLAVQLDASQIQMWQTALRDIIGPSDGKTAETTVQGFKGTTWVVPGNRGQVRLIKAGDWLVVTLGGADAGQEMLLNLKNSGRPVAANAAWLQAEIDWPRLAVTDLPLKPAVTAITVNFKDDNLRTTITARYPQDLAWKSAEVRVPTNIVMEPIISFTAMQNPAAFLAKALDFRAEELNPMAGQLFVWAQGHMPFQTFAAFPVNNSSNRLRSLAQSLPKAWNQTLTNLNQSQLRWDTNRQNLAWSGLAIIAPFLEAATSPVGDFLVAGLFPQLPSKTPPPVEMLKQIREARNLAFYDWEITQYRLMQWRGLSQLLPWFPLRPGYSSKERLQLIAPIDSNAASQKWLTALAPMLGNTVTEVTVPSPNQAVLVRKSHLGLTGVELVTLAHWLTDPVELREPPRSAVPAPAIPAPEAK